MEGQGSWGQRVRLSITARRVRIDPAEKRRRYIRRLEDVMRECDRIVSEPKGYEELQVKALALLIRAVKVCYEMVTDAEVEMIEAQAEEIRRAVEERRRGGQEPASS